MDWKKNGFRRRPHLKGDKAYKMERDICIAIVIVFPFLIFLLVLLFCSLVFEHGSLGGALLSLLLIVASTRTFYDAHRILLDQRRISH